MAHYCHFITWDNNNAVKDSPNHQSYNDEKYEQEISYKETFGTMELEINEVLFKCLDSKNNRILLDNLQNYDLLRQFSKIEDGILRDLLDRMLDLMQASPDNVAICID